MRLVLLPILSLSIQAVHAHLLIIFLKGCHVLAGLTELPFFHPLPYIPVDKGTLGVHQVKLVVKSSPCLSNGGGVGEHADSPLDLGEVTTRHHGGGLVVDANLEPCGAPVHKLNRPFCLDSCNSSI